VAGLGENPPIVSAISVAEHGAPVSVMMAMMLTDSGSRIQEEAACAS
jgi:hypothetical protein